jgi:hypothetical protein
MRSDKKITLNDHSLHSLHSILLSNLFDNLLCYPIYNHLSLNLVMIYRSGLQ